VLHSRSVPINKILQILVYVLVWASASELLPAVSSGISLSEEGYVYVLGNTSGDKEDPWKKLQQLTREPAAADQSIRHQDSPDPWARLRAIYLPFSQEDETAAEADRIIRQKVSDGLLAAVSPYAGLIRRASSRFDVPEEIIAAVIMVESGGNHKAKAPTSTASGLMQTISATFSDARHDLSRRGTPIADTPFDPEASIMAGTWFLDRMYLFARRDNPDAVGPRNQIDSWKKPLEYYYAGPGHGVKSDPVIIIYSGGEQVVVDKPAYSSKVLRWARIMDQEIP
jgi:soluble lytic murein transglycosylase-like protein